MQSVDQIIRSVLLRVGDSENNRYVEAVDYFYDIFRDLRQFHIRETKTVKLEINLVLKTVDLPSDYVDYLAVGVPINGEMFSFSRANKVIKIKTDPLGEIADSELGEGEDIERSCGVNLASGGFNSKGYFDIDLQNRRIILKNIDVNQTFVLLEYVSNGIEDLEKSFIDLVVVNYLKAELLLKLSAREKSFTNAQRAEFREDRNIELTKLQLSKLPTSDELLDAIYQTSGRGGRRWH